MTFKESTPDRGVARNCNASDNHAIYILTSAMAHDLYDEYVERYNRLPTSAWYRRHFTFTRVN